MKQINEVNLKEKFADHSLLIREKHHSILLYQPFQHWITLLDSSVDCVRLNKTGL